MSDAVEAWVASGCPDAYVSSPVFAALTPQVVFSHLLDVVFGRGAARHLHVDPYPPGCEDVDESEWEFKFRDDYVGVDDDEFDDVPDHIRMMHPMGSRGYRAARAEYGAELYEEKLSDIKRTSREPRCSVGLFKGAPGPLRMRRKQPPRARRCS